MKSPKFLHRNQLSPQLPPPRISSIFSTYDRLNFASSVTPRLLIPRIVISIPIVSNRRWEVNINIDLLKIQGMFGQSRFLFTIKEEEREDLKLPTEKSLCAASKNKLMMRTSPESIFSVDRRPSHRQQAEHWRSSALNDSGPAATNSATKAQSRRCSAATRLAGILTLLLRLAKAIASSASRSVGWVRQ
ncbi:hypothetical protein PHJA_001691300 [Phtheirospermum japonicum]|uniref:Uncharacterized protein n=1 Tax=Phtheirospermum japonicum TaxID=374723 RepID=A0A830C7G9_9LAMI|nr:hypothetical protein PHJA_001691300 [Phtheirospermum japonicum]